MSNWQKLRDGFYFDLDLLGGVVIEEFQVIDEKKKVQTEFRAIGILKTGEKLGAPIMAHESPVEVEEWIEAHITGLKE